MDRRTHAALLRAAAQQHAQRTARRGVRAAWARLAGLLAVSAVLGCGIGEAVGVPVMATVEDAAVGVVMQYRADRAEQAQVMVDERLRQIEEGFERSGS